MASSSQGAQVPAALQDFLRLYEAGRYWDSHEALEDAWRSSGSAFYQGLILYASAWVHWERGNAHGVRAQLRKALERLAGYPTGYLGLDVAAVRKHCIAVMHDVAEEPDGWQDRVAAAPLQFSQAHFRGDEIELRDQHLAD